MADGLQRDGPHVREPVDALVREGLAKAGVPYRVVYGSGEERTRNALAPVLSLLGEADEPAARWTRSATVQRPLAPLGAAINAAGGPGLASRPSLLPPSRE